MVPNSTKGMTGSSGVEDGSLHYFVAKMQLRTMAPVLAGICCCEVLTSAEIWPGAGFSLVSKPDPLVVDQPRRC